MTNLTKDTEEKLRRMFKSFNPLMLDMWRLGLGSLINAWPEVGGRIMVITHTGRKSGLRRQTPVNYALIDGEVYCTAGFGAISDWYRNMQADPRVEVWLPDGWWEGEARDVTEEAGYLEKLRQVLIASGFAARLAGINPQALSEAELAQATQGYRLVHIRRTAPRTDPGGPGELAWVWPVATFILLPLAFRKRRRRK